MVIQNNSLRYGLFTFLYHRLTVFQLEKCHTIKFKETTSCDSLSPKRSYEESVPACYCGDYEVHKLLQTGGQARVFTASKYGLHYVLKVYHYGLRMEQDFFNEVNILKTLSSPNITPLIEHLSQIVFQYEEEKSLRNVLVMPYAAHKDLRLEIYMNGSLDYEATRFIAKRLYGVLRYLEPKQILHRDIKPYNILLTENYDIQLTDFGLATHISTKDGFPGDINYAAPYVLKQKACDRQSEIFSLGILLFYVHVGILPFRCAKITESYRLFMYNKPHEFWKKIEAKVNRKLSYPFKRMISAMLRPNPSSRPNQDTINYYYWFSQPYISHESFFNYMRKRSSIDTSNIIL